MFLTVCYCVELHLGALELLRFIIGALALWMPLGGWLYLLLRKEVPDRTIRVAFSAGSSRAALPCSIAVKSAAVVRRCGERLVPRTGREEEYRDRAPRRPARP